MSQISWSGRHWKSLRFSCWICIFVSELRLVSPRRLFSMKLVCKLVRLNPSLFDCGSFSLYIQFCVWVWVVLQTLFVTSLVSVSLFFPKFFAWKKSRQLVFLTLNLTIRLETDIPSAKKEMKADTNLDAEKRQELEEYRWRWRWPERRLWRRLK